MESRGILYVATGSSCLDEAISNAKETRLHSPNIPIAVSTDLVADALSSRVFDITLTHKSPHYSYRDKIIGLLDLPFRHTLFLDSDAFVAHPIDSLFKLSEFSDFAASLAPVRHPPGWNDTDVPLSFPEFNSGVMLFRKSRRQHLLVKRWLDQYDHLNHHFGQQWDQASLRSVVWKLISKSRLVTTTLSPEFNLRTPKPWVVGRGMPVFIVHGRFDRSEISSLLHYLNHDYDRFRSSAEWLNQFPDSTICPKFDRSYLDNTPN